MLLFWRKFLFYVLLVVYLILTPYAILYALGYWVAPSSGELINKTGLLSVITEPRGARIFVEGKKFSRRTPAAVRGLLPGEYEVQLTKKGYESWKQDVKVLRGKAARLEPVILLPLKPEEEDMTEQPFYTLLPLLTDFRITGLQSVFLDSLTGVDIFLKREGDSGQKIPNAGSIPVLDFYTKPGSALVVFKTGPAEQPGWFAVHLGKEKEGKDISSLVPPGADFIDWDAKSPDFLYYLKNGAVDMVDWHNGQVTPLVPQDVLGMGVKNGRVHLLKKDFTLWSLGAKGGELKAESAEEEGLQKLKLAQGDARWFRIEILKRDIFQKDLMLFLSDGGRLLSNRQPYVLGESEVGGFQYATHSDDEKVLFWTRSLILSVDFVKASEEDFQKSPVKAVLVGEGRAITQAFWAYDDSHIIYRDGDSVYLAEARSGKAGQVRLLTKVAPGSSIYYHELAHTLYYLSPQTSRLVRRKITD